MPQERPGETRADREELPEAVVDEEDLHEEPFVALGREDGSRQAVDHVHDEAGVHVDVRYESHFGDTACALVAEGLGLSVVDPFAAERWRDVIAIRPFMPRVPCWVYLTRSRSQVSSLVQQKFEAEFRLMLEADDA